MSMKTYEVKINPYRGSETDVQEYTVDAIDFYYKSVEDSNQTFVEFKGFESTVVHVVDASIVEEITLTEESRPS